MLENYNKKKLTFKEFYEIMEIFPEFLRPNILKITSDYLKHCLDSKDTAIQTQTRKSTIPFLGAQQLSNIKIDLVELKKQKVIIEKIQVLKNKINKLKIQIIEYENDIKNITTKKT